MVTENRLIEIPADGIIRVPIMQGDSTVGERRIDLSDIPVVDAVEVVHGHWVSLTECSNAGVYCSVCQKKVYKEDYAWANRKNKLRSNYCPNCGARMDGKSNVERKAPIQTDEIDFEYEAED